MRILSNFAREKFLSITFLLPFASRTASSFGRLKAIVCTPAFVSPPVNTTSTTLTGDSLPRFGFLCSAGMGRLISSFCWYFLMPSSFLLSAGFRIAMKASKAAL